MQEESVARRYAAALFARASQSNTIDTVHEDLNTVARAVRETGFLRALLNQPVVPEARKKEVVRSAFTGKVQDGVLAFMDLLMDKRRINLLDQVQAEFERLVREHRNIASAVAVSAVPLTPEQGAALANALKTRTGKHIELKTEVDPSLIGGVLVRIGDTVLDGSVRGNLERLREQLLARR